MRDKLHKLGVETVLKFRWLSRNALTYINHLRPFREARKSERSYVGPPGLRAALNDLDKLGSLSREQLHVGRGLLRSAISTLVHRN